VTSADWEPSFDLDVSTFMPEPPLLAVLDYGIGNLRSAQKALEKVGADARLTSDLGLIRDAAAVVLPGVGAFRACMDALASAGLIDAVHESIGSGRPFLGICVGCQMLFDGSDENPDAEGLGVLAGTVRRLPAGVRHPQMQWNVLRHTRRSALLEPLADETWMYFVHSFAPVADDRDVVVGTCDYGGPIDVVFERANVMAVQFHPEKSGRDGLALLSSFVDVAHEALIS
jgi:imidazole glycerol-phosphate synthase subunit HisH